MEKTKKSDFFPYAADEQEKTVELTVLDEEGNWGHYMSFINTGKSEDELEFTKKYPTKKVEVKAMPIQAICEREGISEIDFISIDIEGYEMNALRGIDFETTVVDILLIENNRLENMQAIRNFMNSKGYNFYARIYPYDDVYVRKGFKE